MTHTNRGGFILATMAALINAASTIVAVNIGVPSSWAQSAAPRYEVDVTFLKPFPDRWVTGGFGGHCSDAQDHMLAAATTDRATLRRAYFPFRTPPL
jgi:hypothetical protein